MLQFDKAEARSPKLIVIGGSAGSIPVVLRLLPALGAQWRVPIVLVIHAWAPLLDGWIKQLCASAAINVNEAQDQQSITDGHIYVAPGGFHLLVDKDQCLHLDSGERLNGSRPSIDVLFDSAGQVYRRQLLAVLLSGANEDGARGLQAVARCGGTTIVQDPADCEFAAMPRAALNLMRPTLTLTTSELVDYFRELGNRRRSPIHDG